MYVTLDHGRPAVSAHSEKAARKFAELRIAQEWGAAPTGFSWTGTGKLMAGSRWTGWEVHPARLVEEEAWRTP